jgi:low temperature requirement protein LtrA
MIHATTENFGDLKRIRLIESKEDKQVTFFRIPASRQYYIDKVLHREEHERRVTWYELFSDLVFIGAIGKAKYLVSYSWFSYFQFLLVFSCIYAHWMTTMA